ncbi:MAG: restriction endonuclease [Nevskia sp.]|jgi:restriction system protein|nr:restriction endonuclease [Nevskia sp.]MCK9386283.1 restriction endonuclease [Nevskia sp.]
MAQGRELQDQPRSTAGRLSPWLAIVIAAVLYGLLHKLAAQPAGAAPKDVAELGSFASRAMMRQFAYLFQYLLPLSLLLAALKGFAGRLHRRRLLEETARRAEASALLNLSWQDFERLVGETFRRRGYAVQETSAGADGGVDLILDKDGENYFVQCKRWRATKVGVEVVRELYGVMAAQGVAGGFVVTAGTFTNPAIRFASGRNIDLIDGRGLMVMLKGNLPTPAAASPAPPAAATAPRKTAATVVTLQQPVILAAGTDPVPECPVCKAPMIRRIARQGSNAGRAFWGCRQYPQCNGVRPIAVREAAA